MEPSGRLPALRDGERVVRQIDNSPACWGLAVSSGNRLRFRQVTAKRAKADYLRLRALGAHEVRGRHTGLRRLTPSCTRPHSV